MERRIQKNLRKKEKNNLFQKLTKIYTFILNIKAENKYIYFYRAIILNCLLVCSVVLWNSPNGTSDDLRKISLMVASVYGILYISSFISKKLCNTHFKPSYLHQSNDDTFSCALTLVVAVPKQSRFHLELLSVHFYVEPCKEMPNIMLC